MRYLESQPSSRWSGHIKCFWSLDYGRTIDGQRPEPVIPDGCVEIIFNLADRFCRYHVDGLVEIQPTSMVAGQIEWPVVIGPSGNVCLFGIRFRPAGASAFFDFEMGELLDLIAPLDAVWGRSICEIEDRLFNAGTFEDRVAIAEAYLSTRVRVEDAADPAVLRSVDLISAARGKTKVQDLCRLAGISERSLERKFRKNIGLSPKAFSRICRFQSVLRTLGSDDGLNLLDAAHDFGYYDQSHLISDFRRYSGLTPTAFAQRARGLTDLFIADV